MFKFLKSKRGSGRRFYQACLAFTVTVLVGSLLGLGASGVARATENPTAEDRLDVATSETQSAPIRLQPAAAAVSPGEPISWTATLAPAEEPTVVYLPGDETELATVHTANDGQIQTSHFKGSLSLNKAELSLANADSADQGTLLCTRASEIDLDVASGIWSTECSEDTTALRIDSGASAGVELLVTMTPADNVSGDVYVLSAGQTGEELVQSRVSVTADSDGSTAILSEEEAESTSDEGQSDAAQGPAWRATGPSEPDVLKNSARVNCPTSGDDATTCTVTWDITIRNGQDASTGGTLIDSTSQEVYDVQAKIRTLGGGELEIISAGFDHSLAIDSNGYVWAWGNNNHGQLGRGSIGGSEMQPGLPGEAYWTPARVNNLSKIVQVSAGYSHSLAVDASGNVWAWGSNALGQLGQGYNNARDYASPVRVLAGAQGGSYLSDIKQASAYESYSVAVTNGGDVYSWGSNQYGVLGNGEIGSGGSGGTITHKEKVTPIRVLAGAQGGGSYLSGIAQVSAGYGHVLALTESGDVYSWGNNTHGQLGIGLQQGVVGYPSQGTPVRVVGGAQGGSGLSRIKQVSAGLYHSVALSDDGLVYSWGDTQFGELGNGSTVGDLSSRNKHSPVRSNVTGITQISAGGYFTLAKNSDDALIVWGSNNFGQLATGSSGGQLNSPARATSIAGVNQVAASKGPNYQWGLAVKSSGEVYGWGNGKYGQLGRGYTYDNSGQWVYPQPATAKVSLGTFVPQGGACASSDWKPLQLGDSAANASDAAFEERTYSSADGASTDGNAWLDIDAGCEVQVQISGKVDRGIDGFVIGNQAWYQSVEYPRDVPDLSQPLPAYNSATPWVHGKWSGNNTCTATSSWVASGGDTCDQVYSQIEGISSSAYISGTVWDATGGSTVPASDGSTGIKGVKVRLTGTRSDGIAMDVSLYTDKSGRYSFALPKPGTYEVTVAKPAEYLSFVSPPAATCPDGGRSCVDANGKVGGLVITSANRTIEDVNAGLLAGKVPSMTLEKGWWDGTAIRNSVIVYEDSWTETVTVKAKNTGSDSLEDLTFTDRRDWGADVAWGTCSVEGTTKTKDLAGQKRPSGVALGFELATGETMTCTGLLEMTSNGVDEVEHGDTVTIAGADGLNESAHFELVLKPSEDKLDAAKGIRSGKNSVASSAVMALGETEEIAVRIINNSGEVLSDPTMTDETLEGPDVENWSCPAPINQGASAQLEADATIWCSGQLTMSATSHEDAVIITAINANGDVLKDRAVFTATSPQPDYPEGSLPRAGRLGIWGSMLIGTAIFLTGLGLCLYLIRPNKPTPRH